jgi:glycosyltransferase involved in cell wall biosynthesis
VTETTPLRVQLIAKREAGRSGTSRYTSELYNGLLAAGVDVRLTFPDPPPLPGAVVRSLKGVGIDVAAFFASHPWHCPLERADVYHITVQTMATLSCFQRFPAPVVVTVLDIIPYLVRHDRELSTSRHVIDRLFYRLALAGLRRAEALIAISEYTKQTLVEALSLPEDRIRVVYPAVDHQRFRPLEVPDAFLQKFGLSQEWHYVLYVGSDDPRKNLKTLVQAFAVVKRQVSDTKLLKVGAPQFAQERQRLLALVDELGLEDDVLFFDQVPDEDLPLLYNLADVFVMPSLYEGFGLPVAEAMSCGTPVVASNRASLPEVVGEEGVLVDPADVEALAQHVADVLGYRRRRAAASNAARRQAGRFSPERQTAKALAIYDRVTGRVAEDR